MTAIRPLSAVALLLVGLGLSGCADMRLEEPRWPWREPAPTVVAPAPEPGEAPQAAAKSRRPAVRPAVKAERKPAPPEPEAKETPQLVGLSEAETAQLLGRPAEESERPPGKIWLYTATGCRLAVHLFPDMDKGGFYTLDTVAEEGGRDACIGRLADEARKKE